MWRCAESTVYHSGDWANWALQLDEDGLKEKKKQRLMKAGFDARQRAKLEKEKEKEEKEREERKEEADRNADLQGWAGRLKKDQEVGNGCAIATLLYVANTLN